MLINRIINTANTRPAVPDTGCANHRDQNLFLQLIIILLTNRNQYRLVTTMVLIPPVNRMTFQKGVGGVNPRLWMRMNLAQRNAYEARQLRATAHARNRVMREREAARARGVNIILDETRADHYVRVNVPDE